MISSLSSLLSLRENSYQIFGEIMSKIMLQNSMHHEKCNLFNRRKGKLEEKGKVGKGENNAVENPIMDIEVHKECLKKCRLSA